jgi:trehalose synthase
MTDLLLDKYQEIVGEDVISSLRQLAEPLRGKRVVHVNSTKEGGGVAEILHRMIPLKKELGLEPSWEVIVGEGEFYQCTKYMHNTLQGNRFEIPQPLLKRYEEANWRMLILSSSMTRNLHPY